MSHFFIIPPLWRRDGAFLLHHLTRWQIYPIWRRARARGKGTGFGGTKWGLIDRAMLTFFIIHAEAQTMSVFFSIGTEHGHDAWFFHHLRYCVAPFGAESRGLRALKWGVFATFQRRMGAECALSLACARLCSHAYTHVCACVPMKVFAPSTAPPRTTLLVRVRTDACANVRSCTWKVGNNFLKNFFIFSAFCS